MGREPTIVIEDRQAKGLFSARINTDPHIGSSL